eukprot:comp22592_c2_seq1/m.34616 comp22592_c2_seq1/g.34616  ORF comp22592_c2_seq1/g.34616 comp22592_c2_seq1/m.34616 type:complete len:292 (-) comp22592_c2_seq1:27-902(-)
MQVRFTLGPTRLLSAWRQYRRDGWFVRDKCGYVCAILTQLLILYAQIVVVCKLIVPIYEQDAMHALVNSLTFLGISVLAVWSHLRCMMTNPGTTHLHSATTADAPLDQYGQRQQLCARCNAFKPFQTHHCKTCDRCIRRMDHHCPWVNNCVGARNTKYFLLFLLYVFLLSVAAFYFIILRVIRCSETRWNGSCRNIISDIVFLAILAFEALLFGLFTIGMFFDMMCNIRSNTTAVDKLRNQYGEKRTFMSGVREICGEPASFRWFLPMCPVPSEEDTISHSASQLKPPQMV